MRAEWREGLGKKGNMQGVVVTVAVDDGVGVSEIVTKDVMAQMVDDIEELGKKKNRVGGKEYGFGVLLRADVEN